MHWPRTRRDWHWAMVLAGLFLGAAGIVMGLATPAAAGANIGAGMMLLLGGTLVVCGLLGVVLDIQHSRRK